MVKVKQGQISHSAATMPYDTVLVRQGVKITTYMLWEQWSWRISGGAGFALSL